MRQAVYQPLDPLAENSQPEQGEPTVRKVRDKPGVLVVDDDHLVRSLVQLGLERNGFEVWQASNGREAISQYRAHRDRIAVVLLDVRMPGLDGPQTLAALRELNPEVLACFMSGPGTDSEREEWRRDGAADVIAKPFLLDQLANLLGRLVQGVRPEVLASGGGCRE
jgi:CheY-like chemotaxis protein